MKKYCFAIFCLLQIVFIENSFSQTITLTSPSSSSSVADGDDFATKQLQNPWDFNERRDIGWEENFTGSSVGVSNGIWSGTNQGNGAYVFPLFPGFNRSIFAEPLSGDLSLPKFGINHRIDASRYNLLCYKLNHSDRGAYAVYWSNDASKTEYWPDGSDYGASADAYYPTGVKVNNSGWQIYCFDMKNLSSEFEQSSGSWSGNIFALRLDPSFAGASGSTTEIDWVRVVDPNSSGNINIAWNATGFTENSIIDIYVDDDNAGYNGTLLKHMGKGDLNSSYAFPTVTLPPGSYFFYVVGRELDGNGQPLTTSFVKSNYSAVLNINQTPIVNIIAPSQTSGQEYSSTEVANAWDMDSAADIKNLDSAYPQILRQFSSASFVSTDAEDGNVFKATADLPLVGNTESDNQIHLNMSSLRPITTEKYRYLVYRIAADDTNFPTISDKVQNGWVTRPAWWNEDVITDGGDPGAHVLYEGWHTYGYDLWNLPYMARGNQWLNLSRIKNLRIDPLETHILTDFYLDWVRLYSENRTANNEYTISWNITDSDNSSFSVSLFYDTDKSGFDGTAITTLNNVTAGLNSYVWNTSGLTEGQSYFIYLTVSDGTNSSSYYSPVHVVAGEFKPQPVSKLGRLDFDYDGDKKSDLVLMRGKIKVNKSGKKIKTSKISSIVFNSKKRNQTTRKHVVVNDSNILSVNFDGDGKTDLCLITSPKVGTALQWTISLSSTGRTITRSVGSVGDLPFKGDFNGDGKEEIGAFNNGTWSVLYASGATTSKSWGQSGDIPVSSDYDGDGVTDYAVYRPNTGEWIIENSGFTLNYIDSESTTTTWGGGSFDNLVPADYDGDGRDDVAFWRSNEGKWYIKLSSSGTEIVHTIGKLGDVAVAKLDINGDGKADPTVFSENNGKKKGAWKHLLSTNGDGYLQSFGKPKDRVALSK